jgi:transposase
MMLFPGSVRVYLCAVPCDLRKGFDGLSGMVTSSLGLDPLSGHLFAFLNKRGDQVRILFCDRTGLCVLAKRLAQGTFCRVVAPDGQTHVEVDSSALALLLEGIDLRGAHRRKRWRTPPPTE